MLQKIRREMRERDSKYKLAEIVAMDDSFFGGPKEGGDKRGLGSSKTAVIVEASTNGDGIGYARITVVDHVDSATIQGLVKAEVKKNQTIKTDGFRAYNIVGKSGHKHQRALVKGKKAHEVLTWTHILISNAKSFILGTFHGIGKKHLQAYLDEFCYRFNHRNWEQQIFDRLVAACVTSKGFCYTGSVEPRRPRKRYGRIQQR